MKKLAIVTLLGLAAMTTGCAADIKNLENLNRSLNAIANGFQGGPAFAQNAMSPANASSFQSKLTPGTNMADVNANWATLRPLAEKMVTLSACGVGPYGARPGNEIEAWKSIGRWVDPDTKNPNWNGSFPLAIWYTQYHSKSSCMNVLRVDMWTKPSKNTLAFRVQFVSDGSDETVNINYLFKLLDDGTWVYNRAQP